MTAGPCTACRTKACGACRRRSCACPCRTSSTYREPFPAVGAAALAVALDRLDRDAALDLDALVLDDPTTPTPATPSTPNLENG